MLITNNKKLYERARVLSLHGMDKANGTDMEKKDRHYDVSEVGYKYNLMDLLSAIGIIQLKKISINYIKRKRKSYKESFKELSFQTPLYIINKNIKHSYHLFNIFLNKKKGWIKQRSGNYKIT